MGPGPAAGTATPGGFSGLTGSLSSDPLSAMLLMMNTLGSYFNTAQEQQMQQQVFGQQESASQFAQSPEKMNQLIGALGQPTAFSTLAGPGGLGGTANQYFQGFQNPYASVANQGTAAQQKQYLQGLQTPYQQALGQQDPSQFNTLANQYTQGLNSDLTATTWNAVQSQLANSGMTQSPGMQSYALAQALAPTAQQNVALGAQLAQAPLQYGLAEQQYGLQAGQQPMDYQLAQQQYGLQAGGLPLQYTLNQQNMAGNLAQNALQYPFQIGSNLAGMFPNYQYAAGAGTP